MAESEVLTPEKETDTSNDSSETQKPETDKPKKDPDKKMKSKKKSKRESVEEVNIQLETENGTDTTTVLTLRRQAKEVKKYAVMRHLAAVLVVILIAIIAVVYAVSYFYDKFGSFTVKIDKYDMVQQGLSLSETPEFDRTTARLNANIVYDMTNISGEDLPDNIDKINGSHNGDNYIAYTFYINVSSMK